MRCLTKRWRSSASTNVQAVSGILNYKSAQWQSNQIFNLEPEDDIRVFVRFFTSSCRTVLRCDDALEPPVCIVWCHFTQICNSSLTICAVILFGAKIFYKHVFMIKRWNFLKLIPDIIPTRNKLHTPSYDGCGTLGLTIDTEYLPSKAMEDCCNEHDIW